MRDFDITVVPDISQIDHPIGADEIMIQVSENDLRTFYALDPSLEIRVAYMTLTEGGGELNPGMESGMDAPDQLDAWGGIQLFTRRPQDVVLVIGPRTEPLGHESLSYLPEISPDSYDIVFSKLGQFPAIQSLYHEMVVQMGATLEQYRNGGITINDAQLQIDATFLYYMDEINSTLHEVAYYSLQTTVYDNGIDGIDGGGSVIDEVLQQLKYYCQIAYFFNAEIAASVGIEEYGASGYPMNEFPGGLLVGQHGHIVNAFVLPSGTIAFRDYTPSRPNPGEDFSVLEFDAPSESKRFELLSKIAEYQDFLLVVFTGATGALLLKNRQWLKNQLRRIIRSHRRSEDEDEDEDESSHNPESEELDTVEQQAEYRILAATEHILVYLIHLLSSESTKDLNPKVLEKLCADALTLLYSDHSDRQQIMTQRSISTSDLKRLGASHQ